MKFGLLALSAIPLLLSSPFLRPEEPPGRVLTFADEFNGAALDLRRWAPHDPWGRVRDFQLQAYSPDAVTVSGGQLHIVARRADAAHPAQVYDGKEREFLSGIITTFGLFAQTYGRFEIRCRVPAGRGLRPGFLLRPIPKGELPAIDVFETTGDAPSRVFLANHWGTEQTERSWGDSFTAPDLSADFHTIALEWDRDRIAWFIDGKETFRSTDGVPHQPMYLLLDLAMGGRLARTPDASTPFPASFDIDYMRVYRSPDTPR